MFEKALQIKENYEKLLAQLSDPITASNTRLYKQLSIDLSAIEDVYPLCRDYVMSSTDIADAKQMLTDSATEEKQYFTDIINELEAKLPELESKINKLTRNIDKDDIRDALIELRAGAGGDEAALFAGDLFKMYLKYAERKNWKISLLSESRTDNGGYKEVIFTISGKGAFGALKYESGVHRVQRIPVTESAGRIHTSAASVVVMTEAEDIDIEIRQEDIRLDVFRAGGPGGQSVNTTDSAVRLTHIPSGLVVSCQDEKSQLKNKAKAMSVLKARLYDLEKQKRQSELEDLRQLSIKTGDRSAKIKTYNFPQSRITDHRVKITWHFLQPALNGDLDEILSSTKEAIES